MEPRSPLSGPDPARVVNLDDLAREFGLLRSRAARGTRSARVSLEDLAHRVGEPRSTIHAYLSGKRLAPSEVLDRIVIALGATPAEQRGWAEAWYRVSAYRATVARVAPTDPPRPDAPRQLPGDVGDFVGRAARLVDLDRLLGTERAGGIAAVVGTAGVGKTAFAVHWAQTRSTRFPDGQLYVDLRGFARTQPVSASQALARFLRALGVGGAELPRELDERAALYRSLIAGRRMLVVLDNARDVEQIAQLLPGSSSCSVLVTSRDNLTGLIVRHGAHRLELDVLPPADASALLGALVGARVAAEPEATERLAAQCARLPLALRIAADIAVSSPSGRLSHLVADLEPAPRRLDLLEAGDDPDTAVRAVFSWSYSRLPPAPAEVFRLIGLHASAEFDAAEVAGFSGLPEPEAQRTLGVLLRLHLVEQAADGRYRMHELLRIYAAEQSGPEPDRAGAPTRVFEHRRSLQPITAVFPTPRTA